MGLMSTLFGSGGKSSSTNQAYPFIQQTYAPIAQGATGSYNALASLLGLGGDQEGAQEGYQQFLDSTGYQNVLDEAMRGITGSRAASGLLRSGGTLTRMQDRAAGLGDQYFTNYLGQLGNLTQQGMGAGQLIAGAGGRSESTGAKGGIAGGLASMASMFSDRRLKRDIELLARDDDGLGWYSYSYNWDGPGTVRNGVMHDEVALLRPWALGPNINGYGTVDYSAL